MEKFSSERFPSETTLVSVIEQETRLLRINMCERPRPRFHHHPKARTFKSRLWVITSGGDIR